MFTTGKNVVASPAIGNSGTVFVGSLDHYLYALSGVTGKKKWSYNTGGAVISAPAIGTDGTVYIGCAVGNLGSVPPPRGILYAIQGKNGIKKWSFSNRVWEIWSSPALGGVGLVSLWIKPSWRYFDYQGRAVCSQCSDGSGCLDGGHWPRKRALVARNRGRWNGVRRLGRRQCDCIPVATGEHALAPRVGLLVF